MTYGFTSESVMVRFALLLALKENTSESPRNPMTPTKEAGGCSRVALAGVSPTSSGMRLARLEMTAMSSVVLDAPEYLRVGS